MEEKHDLGSCKCSTKIRGLTVRKHNGVILHDVNLDVEHGEIMALIGRNGAGKTTLLKALLGRIAYEGSVLFTDHRGNRVQRPRIGYVPQSLIFDHSTPMTVADLMEANLSRRPVWFGHRKEELAQAEAVLAKAGARPGLLKKRIGTLSGGELQRVLLALALQPMPDLLLLDEPVSALDRRGTAFFYELVCSLRSEYHMPVILVSHDLAHVQKYATSAALLDKTVIISGRVDKVMASDQVREVFGLPIVGRAGR